MDFCERALDGTGVARKQRGFRLVLRRYIDAPALDGAVFAPRTGCPAARERSFDAALHRLR
jgi:hypothetical protein